MGYAQEPADRSLAAPGLPDASRALFHRIEANGFLMASGASPGDRLGLLGTKGDPQAPGHGRAVSRRHARAGARIDRRVRTGLVRAGGPRHRGAPRAVRADRLLATAADREGRFTRRWDWLVPSSGAAATVQGEVVRIAGRIAREIDGNGGVAWDAHFRMMSDAWLAHVGTGAPLPLDALAEAGQVVADAKGRRGGVERLRALAVAWVVLNPQRVELPPPAYDR